MKSTTIQKLQQRFIGKVCSVVSTAMNRDFDENICREHFVIKVTDIDQDGIWGEHPYNQEMVSFFSIEHLISIHEEQVIDPNNPKHKEMLEEAKEKFGETPKGDLRDSPDKKAPSKLPVFDQDAEAYKKDHDSMFVDIDMLSAIAEKSRETFDAEDKFKEGMFGK